MITVLKIAITIVLSYGAAYAITMTSFWIDLNINHPGKEQIEYMKKGHLRMNKWVWLGVFLMMSFYVIAG